MKIAVCFFGEFQFIDMLMIHSWRRCILIPLQKYKQNEIEFIYYLHTFLSTQATLTCIGTMTEAFPLEEIRIHKKSVTLFQKATNRIRRAFSLHQIRSMWSESGMRFDLVLYLRLDALPTCPLSTAEIEHMMGCYRDRRLFIPYEYSARIDECMTIGNPTVMRQYGDDFLSIPSFCQEHKITTSRLSLVMVRIRGDATVDERDHQNCPYLDDLLSTSKIVRGSVPYHDVHSIS